VFASILGWVSGGGRRPAPAAPALQDRRGTREPEAITPSRLAALTPASAPVEAVVGADGRGLRHVDSLDRRTQRLVI